MVAYFIAVFGKDAKLFLVEVAHSDAFDLMRHFSMDTRARGADEHAEVHHGISCAL